MVVGFQHLEKKTLGRGRGASPGRVRLLLLGPLRAGRRLLRRRPRDARSCRRRRCTRSRRAATTRRAWPSTSPRRIVDCHLATMERLGIRYDLLAHESDILRLHFWDRAFELLKADGRHPPRDRRQERGLLGPGRWTRARTRRIDEDKIIVRSNGTVTYTGKDIAYQLWKLGLLDRDFRYRRHRTYPDGHVLWTHDQRRGRAGRARASATRDAVYNVIDVGQSYPQRVVKAGVAALGHAEGAPREPPPRLREGRALPRHRPRPRLRRLRGRDASVKVSGRKGLGVKADDLIDALVAKARSEIDARDPERDAAAREAHGRAPSPPAPCATSCCKFGRTKIITFDMEEALAFTGETGPYVQNARRARAQHLRQAGGRGPRASRRSLAARAARSTSTRSSRRGGRRGVGAAAADGAQRGDRRAGGAGRGGGARWPSTPSRWPRPSTPTTRSRSYSVLHAESEELRAFRALVVDAFVRQMAGPDRPARHPGPGADVMRAAHRHHASATRAGPRDLHRCATTTCARWRRRGGLPLVLRARAARGRRGELLDRLDGLRPDAAGPTSTRRSTASAPHPSS